MSEGGDFFVGRLLLVMSVLLLAAECNSNTVSTYFVVYDTESTMMLYDMSTEPIAPTYTISTMVNSMLLTSSPMISPSPTSTIEPNIEEMENNAIVMSFNDINLEQWMQIESIFLSAIADECTRQCARNYVDCGVMYNVNYTSDDVIILPGYPKIVDGKLSIAFSVSLPSEAIVANNTGSSVISQDILLGIAAAATAAITAQTGVQVNNIGRYTAPATATTDSSKSESNLALILCLTLIIPAAIIISIAAGFGSFYVWKMVRKHHKSLDLVNKIVKTEEVELMSYKPTLDNN